MYIYVHTDDSLACTDLYAVYGKQVLNTVGIGTRHGSKFYESRLMLRGLVKQRERKLMVVRTVHIFYNQFPFLTIAQSHNFILVLLFI